MTSKDTLCGAEIRTHCINFWTPSAHLNSLFLSIFCHFSSIYQWKVSLLHFSGKGYAANRKLPNENADRRWGIRSRNLHVRRLRHCAFDHFHSSHPDPSATAKQLKVIYLLCFHGNVTNAIICCYWGSNPPTTNVCKQTAFTVAQHDENLHYSCSSSGLFD